MTLDFAGTFQMGHPRRSSARRNRLTAIAPPGFDHVFFTNSGSEVVDTALKIALAYHRARGNAGKVRLIGRERGYHGVNLGGTSVGGIGSNRKTFGALVAGVDHLRHTHDLSRNAFAAASPSTAWSLPTIWSGSRLARPIEHRRRHRRAGRLLDGRADSAEGLLEAPCRHLRQARHPADLR